MSTIDRILPYAFVMILGALLLAAPADAAKKTGPGNSCVSCHSGLPGSSFVGAKSHSWLGSSDPKSPVYFKNIPSTCGKCHGAEFYKFSQSLHYRRLEAAGRGPECVTCHGSMVTSILTPDTIAAVCEQCHNARMGIFPYIPQKAKAVLLLLKESEALLGMKEQLSHSAAGSAKARALQDARSSLHSAVLDWHKFDLDTITAHLQKMYDSLEAAPEGKQRR
jgi:hypothetical protein